MSLTTTIAGFNVTVLENSFKLSDKVDERSRCSFTVLDATGTLALQKGQPVSVVDSVLGTLFTGYVNQPNASKLYPNAARLWSVDCVDQTYLLDKRASNKIYSNQFAGTIVADQLQRYSAAENVTGAFALRWDELETDWQAGTLTNTVGTTNATDGNPGDGDLELTLAGNQVVVSGSGSGFVLGNGLKLTGYASSGYTTAYTYRQIWAGSQVIGSSGNDFFEYDVWVDSSSPQIKAAVDFTCSDGTTLRSTAVTDAQGLSPDPGTDLSGLANDQWFTRFFFPPPSLYGKTIISVAVALGGTNAGTYTAYFRRITYNPNGGPQLVIFGDNSTLQTNTQILNIGYSNVALTQVSVEDKTAQTTHTGLAIGAASIVRNSQMVWTVALPNGATGVRETSIDNGASWQAITSGSTVPNLLAGMAVTGRSVLYRDTFTVGKDPTSAIGFGGPTLIVNPACASTKTDSITTYQTATDFSDGTLTNLVTVGSGSTDGITLNGVQRNWDNAFFGSQTIFGANGPDQVILNKQLQLSSGANLAADVRSRLDFAGLWQNFMAEVDIQIPSVSNVAQSGLVYRCTGWQNANDTYAYVVAISQTQISLGRGTNSNSGSGAFTLITQKSVSLTSNSIHRLKIVINANTHQVYLDDVLYITATDSTYPNAGYIGLRSYNPTNNTLTALYDNFGVCATLSGTWQSPSIDIAGPGTYGSSAIFWDINGLPDTTTTITAQTSIDGGATWQSVTNGGTISGLSAGQSLTGKTLLLKLTLTASNAPVVPVLSGVTAWITGQYSSNGTRISPALALSPVGRAGTALVNWNANIPPNTSLAVATSVDGGATYQTVASAGDGISGIAVQPGPVIDTFASNDSASYTQSNFSGGVTGTWTWDTANSRLIGSGGTNGTLTNSTALAEADNQVMADFDECDGSGLVANYVDANDLYFAQIWDSQGTGTQNSVKLFKRSSGVSTQLGSTVAISFPRGNYRRFILDVQAGVITVSMDGIQLIQQTDGSPLGAGNGGLLLNTLVRCYSLRIQQYGENVSALSLLTKLTLSSTDPTATPQVLDLQALVSSPALAQGVLMPSSKYQNTVVSTNIDDLNKQSNYWWYVKSDKSVIFQPRNAIPAPWILSSANNQPIAGQQIGDVLVQNLNVQYSGDLYRNQQVMTGAIDTALFAETKAGDGQTRTWNVANPLAAPPTITLNGQSVSIGIKGVDTGKQYYYQLGSTSISQDSSQALLEEDDVLSIIYTGSFSVDVTVNNTGGFPGTVSQSQMAAIDGSSGIVTAIQDVSSTPTTKAAATTQANQLLQRYGILSGRTLTFRTLHGGLQPGQQLTAFVPEENVADVQFLIAQVDTTITTLAGGVLQYWYDVTACEGPVLGSWVRLFASGLGG